MRHEHKSGAWFELPDDLTWRQLEEYEKAVNALLKQGDVTDATLSRAAIEGALVAGFLKPGEGCPSNAGELSEFGSARLMWWMAVKISEFIQDIKMIDPKPSGRRR